MDLNLTSYYSYPICPIYPLFFFSWLIWSSSIFINPFYLHYCLVIHDFLSGCSKVYNIHPKLIILYLEITNQFMFSLRSLQQYTSISSPYFCAIVVIYIFLINLFILFIYFWLHWVFVAVCGLSLVAESGGHSSLQCPGFSLRWLLLLRSTGSRHAGVSSCGTRAQ